MESFEKIASQILHHPFTSKPKGRNGPCTNTAFLIPWSSCFPHLPIIGKLCTWYALNETMWTKLCSNHDLKTHGFWGKCSTYITRNWNAITFWIIPSELHVTGRENYIYHNFFQEHWICSEENSFISPLGTWVQFPKFSPKEIPWCVGYYSSWDEGGKLL